MASFIKRFLKKHWRFGFWLHDLTKMFVGFVGVISLGYIHLHHDTAFGTWLCDLDY